jgi:hypothetical protein
MNWVSRTKIAISESITNTYSRIEKLLQQQ